MYKIYIFISLLSLTLQEVQTAIFCDNYVREIYLVNETTKTQTVIDQGWEQHWSYPYYFNLRTDPGALIKVRCYNAGHITLGGGCFLINNICRCYNFNIDNEKLDKNRPCEYEVIFNNNIKCKHTAYWLEGTIIKDYYYYHYIPLDVNQIECMNNTILMVPKDVEYSIKFSDFIEATFNIIFKNINN